MTSLGGRQQFPESGLVPLSQDEVIELPFEPGEVIGGKYEVVNLIGSGGMGYVVSARHVELDELVALKFLRQEALTNQELVERFAREARAAARIRSEHVARVFDVGSLPSGVPFIVMEHLEGKDLADVLHERGRLPVATAVEYIMQACEALASAHAVGIVHRDVKPENLFLTRRDVIKVLDFGISKVALSGAASGPRAFVRTMLPLGSPVYMSPEQIRASDSVDLRTDVWSLGCVLFELLTGATPFDAPSLMQLGAAILEREPISMRALAPELPAELEAVVLRCLEKDLERRYQNTAELAVALYPFAPRRARLFAERCSSLLESLGSSSNVELSSMRPPAFSEVAPRRGTGPVEFCSSSPAMKTATLPQVTVTAEVAEVATPRRARRWLAIGLVTLAGVGGVLAWQQIRSPGSDAAVTGASSGVSAATRVQPAAAAPAGSVSAGGPGAASSGAAQPGETEPAAATMPGASAAADAESAASSGSRRTAPARSRARAAGAKWRNPSQPRPATTSDEPDVGF